MSAENEDKNFDVESGIIKDYIPCALFFSNSIEYLFDKLKDNLFPSGSTPFSKRLVIVPSQAIDHWIRLNLAQDLNISTGIETSFLENAVHELFDIERLPSKLELTLSIEYEIHQIKHKWSSLKRYLKGKDRHIISLSKQLAKLFIRYGIYGRGICKQWEREPKGWQEELWNRVFKRWTYPLRMLETLKTKPCEASVHLFSFSHISPLYFHFFQQLSNVCFYQLSPCQEFWSDLSIEHPILTHFSRVSREMARLVEESDVIIDSVYDVPKKKTQLHAVQRELLFLDKEDKIEDDSIQLHIAVTPYHEIQSLYDTIVKLLQQESLEPKDIIVMAPDIALYEPFIKATFKDPLSYQILDMPMQKKHSEVEGLFLLLDLESHRYSASAVLKLFHHPLFKKKMGWSDEDLMQIKKWVEQTGIRWGLDAENRNAILKKRLCKQGMNNECATWKAGVDLLLEELAILHKPTRINFTQSELLGEWKRCLDLFAADFASLHELRTFLGWIDFLKEMHKRYFFESEEVTHQLDRLSQASCPDPDHTYSFETIEKLLRENIGEKSISVNMNNLQSIRFCSMLPMRAVPAKVICLIGMNHDKFPRKDSFFSLNLLENQGDYMPSRLDFDMNLVLEALLSAREKLIISYLGRDPYDQTPWPPSSCVAQLLPYISKTVKHRIQLPLSEKEEAPSLFVYRSQEVKIPSCQIDLIDFSRAFRSPLRHYLYHQEIYMQDGSIIKDEETFKLSALQRYILRTNPEPLKMMQRGGDFPVGSFRTIAERQILKERETFPKNTQTVPVNIKVGDVQITGSLEGVLPEGLCLFEKKTLKNTVKNWPLFLSVTQFFKLRS